VFVVVKTLLGVMMFDNTVMVILHLRVRVYCLQQATLGILGSQRYQLQKEYLHCLINEQQFDYRLVYLLICTFL